VAWFLDPLHCLLCFSAALKLMVLTIKAACLLARRVVGILVLIALSGCQTAFLTLPGKQLSGEAISTSSFKFASGFSLLQLEVRPAKPYSIWLRVVMKADELYIDAAPNRRWHKYLKDDSRVRVKLGNNIYPADAVLVTDEKLLKTFLRGRSIYRLDPIQTSHLPSPST
jgi:hypothetical protein